MRICRFDRDRLGIVDRNDVIDVSEAIEALPAHRWPYPPGDPLIVHWDNIRARVEQLAARGVRKPLGAVSLRSPITSPTKIIGIARNRRNLADEKVDSAVIHGTVRQDQDPIQMFIKAPSAVVGPADGVALRFPDRRNDPEAELSVIIGKAGTNIPRARAFEHVFGYCIGFDMTLRGPESMSSRKSIDSYAVLGPWIVTRDSLPDPDNMDTLLEINGRPLQKANTRDLAFDVASIVAHASTFYTLHPGDVIMVGTPAGFEQTKSGDVLVATFSGIGRMEVHVRSAS
jgi:2-keto-4-pentenoate hydratase/2-oxohepta-3-ene-1,7-dioic acid hydratase in catechol pathway